MHFVNITALMGSLLMATASASTPASFEVPGSALSTSAAPGVESTTIFFTSTYTLASINTATSTNSIAGVSTTGYVPPPVEPTSSTEVSLYVTASQTYVPVTLWNENGTTVIFPQNSTAIETSTELPLNGTAILSTVVVTASQIAIPTTPTGKTSASVSVSASLEPSNNAAVKTARHAIPAMAIVAGLMVLL